MILGIDASNISSGGGLNHLKNLLNCVDPTKYGFSSVVLWSSQATLDKLDNHAWLLKCNDSLLERGLLYRSYWKVAKLTGLVKASRCDLLFVPGGSYLGSISPVVTMSRNLLPFEFAELKRFGISFKALKLLLLRFIQSRTFRTVEGVIFLTEYAQSVVLKTVKHTDATLATIPHGLDAKFFNAPKPQLSISNFRFDSKPVKAVYVSIIELYKHQWNVALAIKKLRDAGIPIELELIGPSSPLAFEKLKNTLNEIDSADSFCHYLGDIPNEELPSRLKESDICVFASSCENMPNILLECMASGLPIACSSRGPMPEILGDAGVFFNPEDVENIKEALELLCCSVELREEFSRKSYAAAKSYSWERCAESTFSFLRDVAVANPK